MYIRVLTCIIHVLLRVESSTRIMELRSSRAAYSIGDFSTAFIPQLKQIKIISFYSCRLQVQEFEFIGD